MGPTAQRPKKPPPITPRRFTKFFTPRARDIPQAVRTSRKALRSITAGTLNSRNRRLLRTVEEPDLVSMPTIDENNPTQVSRKRKYSAYSATPSIASSPIKAGGFLSSSQERGPVPEDGSRELLEEEEAETELEDGNSDSEEEEEMISVPARTPYRSLSTSTGILSARLTGCRSRKEVLNSYAWQDETANFVSSPEDVYECNTSAGHVILPFCVTSCNTNSLIAIGEEEGGIRLIETAAGDKKGFSQSYLNIKPHDNAIMDLEFSDDDRLLATASGDQTSHVIDMSTQTSIFCLAGHYSSIKQVQFQPASGNQILATCSRDGNINIWDMRTQASDRPSFHLRSAGSAAGAFSRHKSIRYVQARNTIRNAHGLHVSRWNSRVKGQPPSVRNDFSVTSLSFLGASRQHMLVTASEAHAVVKLWDIRATYTDHRGLQYRAVPISSTAEPATHLQNRSYGLTSLAMSGDGSRLYAMCRDNNIYAYSTAHLLLGGPIYGFTHPRLRVATFYPKLAIRKAQDEHTELLAAGSSDDCAVLFPTNERYLTKSTQSTDSKTGLHVQGTKLYNHGTALNRAHNKEVTAVTWSSDGALVTVSDDFTSRCWREDAQQARELRLKGEAGGRRWMMGWAEVEGKSYDDE